MESSNNNKNNPLLRDTWASPKILGASIGRVREEHEENGDISLSAQNKNNLFSSKQPSLQINNVLISWMTQATRPALNSIDHHIQMLES